MEKKLKQLNQQITPRAQNFAQWYTDVTYLAGLFNYSPVKGFIIFKPYGYAIWENIQKYLNQIFQTLGVKNVYFPLLIPQSVLELEKEQVQGFNPELATVTHIGNKPLPEKLYIRPTSEVLICKEFAESIHSWRDLPLMYNQWCNVMRWEKNTRPFLRTNEFLWQEGHTTHSTAQEASQLTLGIAQIYQKMMYELLAINPIVGYKSEMEKFAGAYETHTLEAMMYDGQALQCGTSHYFGQNLARIFKITFESKEQKLKHAYSTSWGVSTRLIGALVMVHGDDNGLVLPFKIAPIQILIIKYTNKDKALNQYCQALQKKLACFRTEINQSSKSAGYQMHNAVLKGIPCVILVGKKDLTNNTCTMQWRHDLVKINIEAEDVLQKVTIMSQEHFQNMIKKADEVQKRYFIKVKDYAEYKQIVAKRRALVLVPFCGKLACEKKVKQETHTTSRCFPYGQTETKAKCFFCAEPAFKKAYFAASY